MNNIKELVSKYRWWIAGAVVVAFIMWNNAGVEAARLAEETSTETTE